MSTVFIYNIIILSYSIAALTAIHALLKKQYPQAAFAWITLLFILPVIGTIAYWFFGVRRANSIATQLMKKSAAAFGGVQALYDAFIPSSLTSSLDAPLEQKYKTLATPGKKITHRNVVAGNTITPLYNGDQAYPKMLDSIAKAQHRIYLSTYIFGNDSVGKQFIQALNNAADRGCKVKILLDGIGSFFPLSGWKKKLHPKAELAYFLPPRLFPPQLFINLRTHKKILVCDGNVGFTGGMNISEENITHLQKPNRVQDINFLCTGPIARHLEAGFLLDWAFITKKVVTMPPPLPHNNSGHNFSRILIDGPCSYYPQVHSIYDLVCSMIASATKHIRIMTPYFLPTEGLIECFSSAVNKGILVDIIIPKKSDHAIFQWAMTHLLPRAINKGISIYVQPEPFAHTKLLLVDDEYTLLGSTNFDPRSFNLNFELILENFNSSLTQELITFFDATKKRSEKITHSMRPSFPIQLRNAFMWLFSPYL